jgi:cation-transporting P-type ATPase E
MLGGFLKSVSNFSVPAGTAVGLGVVASYLGALHVANLPLVESRTVATTVMLMVSLYLIVVLVVAGRRRGTTVTVMCALLAGVYFALTLIPFTRTFFALAAPNVAILLISAAGCVVAVAGLVLTFDSYLPGGGKAKE